MLLQQEFPEILPSRQSFAEFHKLFFHLPVSAEMPPDHQASIGRPPLSGERGERGGEGGRFPLSRFCGQNPIGLTDVVGGRLTPPVISSRRSGDGERLHRMFGILQRLIGGWDKAREIIGKEHGMMTKQCGTEPPREREKRRGDSPGHSGSEQFSGPMEDLLQIRADFRPPLQSEPENPANGKCSPRASFCGEWRSEMDGETEEMREFFFRSQTE